MCLSTITQAVWSGSFKEHQAQLVDFACRHIDKQDPYEFHYLGLLLAEGKAGKTRLQRLAREGSARVKRDALYWLNLAQQPNAP